MDCPRADPTIRQFRGSLSSRRCRELRVIGDGEKKNQVLDFYRAQCIFFLLFLNWDNGMKLFYIGQILDTLLKI